MEKSENYEAFEGINHSKLSANVVQLKLRLNCLPSTDLLIQSFWLLILFFFLFDFENKHRKNWLEILWNGILMIFFNIVCITN